MLALGFSQGVSRTSNFAGAGFGEVSETNREANFPPTLFKTLPAHRNVDGMRARCS
jgi:hypothetical protein